MLGEIGRKPLLSIVIVYSVLSRIPSPADGDVLYLIGGMITVDMAYWTSLPAVPNANRVFEIALRLNGRQSTLRANHTQSNPGTFRPSGCHSSRCLPAPGFVLFRTNGDT
ncbi:hypothetical protein C8Q73DRAFT_52257 [Cubamyces lactineus]|nr:hypothetical protein C8Q73DRAFT_52257 [Cubamyces lactineus]